MTLLPVALDRRRFSPRPPSSSIQTDKQIGHNSRLQIRRLIPDAQSVECVTSLELNSTLWCRFVSDVADFARR